MSTPKHNPGTPANQARVRQSILHSTFDALKERTAGIEHFPVFLEECFEARVWEKERAFASGRPCPPVSFHEFVHEQFPVGLGSSYATIEAIIAGNNKLVTLWESASGRERGTVSAKKETLSVNLAPAIARALDPWVDRENPNASDDDDDDELEPEAESSKLYRVAIEMMRPFSGAQLADFEAVLSQLLGRVKKQILGAR